MSITLRRGQSPTATTVRIGPVTFVFSYETCVAFRDETGWCVSENVWSRTTGKHLTQETPVPRQDRVPYEEFVRRLDEVQSRLEVRGKVFYGDVHP